MAKQTINIGSAPNDGTGDTARDAFDICNDNFTELYDGKVEPNTAFTGDLVFNEAADHASTPAAGKGYLWVKSTAPSTLVFTDDSGSDTTLGSGGGASQLSDLTDVNTSTPTNRNVLVADGVDWESRALTEADISDFGTYLTDVVSDTTPQLGGNLDVQANSITTSTVNGGITLTPNGTGDVTLGNFVFDADQTVGAGQDNYVFTYDNATGKVSLEAAAGGGGGAFTADGDGLISATSAPVLDAATGDEAAYTFNYTTNKATSGNDTGLLINQTDTASPGTSLLADFQVGGDSRFFFGSTHFVQDYASGGVFSANGSGFYKSGLRNTGVETTGYFGITGLANINTTSSTDTRLYRDAANTLALRNSTNAQTLRVYSTYTDASNRENLAITGNAITVETAGTGTDDIDLTLTPAGAGNVKFGTHSAIGAETVTGYITIKDSGGTTRKLAVVS